MKMTEKLTLEDVLECRCGCGRSVREGSRFIHGHNQRGRKNFGVVKAHLGIPRTKETCDRISETRKGITFSEAHKKNLSLVKLGLEGTSINLKMNK
jgi:hypothetical protein